MTVADWYRDDVCPKVLNRHPNANELDYLFFPNEKNREKLFILKLSFLVLPA